MADTAKILEFINHYKRKLDLGDCDDKEIIRIFNQLKKVRMNVDLLQATGIGKSVHSFRKWDGEVGQVARSMVAEWKQNVNKVEKKSKTNSAGKSSHSNAASVSNGKSSNMTAKMSSDDAGVIKKKIKVEVVEENSKIENGMKVGLAIKTENNRNSKMSRSSSPSPEKMSSEFHSNKNFNSERQNEKNNKKTEKAAHVSVKGRPNSSRSGDSKSSSTSSKIHSESIKREPEVANIMFLSAMDAPSVDAKTEKFNSKVPVTGKSEAAGKKRTKKLTKAATEEGFNATMASFEDCLGLPDDSRSRKKKKLNPVIPAPTKSVENKGYGSGVKETKHSVKVSSLPAVNSVAPGKSSVQTKSSNLQDMTITSTLPEIQPNYKPLRYSIMPDGPSMRPKKRTTEVDDGSFMSSRHIRTQVFSGRRQFLTEVPRLFDVCMKVLQENINDLTFTGGVPYDILQPLFEKCTPVQLYTLEDYNPYLLEDTDQLWEKHCEREFKNQKPDEMESWRELYLRLYDEREVRLKRITANISASVAKTLPVRKTKLAFLDCDAKPPRNVARMQMKLGIVPEPSRKVTSKSASSLKQQLLKPPSASESISVPLVSDPGPSATGTSQQKVVKRVAPLMQKTLKFMKNRFRR